MKSLLLKLLPYAIRLIAKVIEKRMLSSEQELKYADFVETMGGYDTENEKQREIYQNVHSKLKGRE